MRRIAVLGLGYVGLPVALAFARKFPNTVGFDISEQKIRLLTAGVDPTSQGFDGEIQASSMQFASTPEAMRGCNVFVVCVPTPVDLGNRPDLEPLRSASRTVGKVISKGSIVVFESTVYPGVTEDVCGKIIAETSGLTSGVDFKLGYSPERINPGDTEHTLERIVKVVSGQDAESSEAIAGLYEAIIPAGVHRAKSIKVAEAAKVIENTQRDLNIALMNELAIICDKLGIPTVEVLEAAGTKWNFLPFRPGLVGGHCIGVDPYYLTTKAEELGYNPQVILAGRRINDGMGEFLAERTVKLLANAGHTIKGARVGVLGLTFKENVSDARNSRVPSIVRTLAEFGVKSIVHDPVCDPEEANHECGVTLSPFEALTDLDGLILSVTHEQFLSRTVSELLAGLKPDGVFVDVKSIHRNSTLPKGVHYWRL